MTGQASPVDGGPALAAVVRYELAASKVAELRKSIGAALARCSVQAESERLRAEGRYEAAIALEDGPHLRTHLHEVFREEVPCDSGYGNRRLEDAEITEILDEQCPACSEAWALIQQRREARAEFGIAKRSIRSIAKAAIRRATLTGDTEA